MLIAVDHGAPDSLQRALTLFLCRRRRRCLQASASFTTRKGECYSVYSLPSPQDVEVVQAAFAYKQQLSERSRVQRGLRRLALDWSASTAMRWSTACSSCSAACIS